MSEQQLLILEKSKLHLNTLNTHCEETRRKYNELGIEVRTLKLKEQELQRKIQDLRQKQNNVKNACEEICTEIDKIKLGQRLISFKSNNHKIHSAYYKEMVQNFVTIEVPNFLNVDEYFTRQTNEQKIKCLETKLHLLQKQSKELMTKTNTIKTNEDVMRHVQKNPSEKIRNLINNTYTIDMALQARKRELEQLLFTNN